MDLPKFEALNLDEPDFIVDPDTQNICFFPLPIFTRISEMLSPSDFVHLAQTCRYMHWRMLTYGHLMLKHNNITIAVCQKKEGFRIKQVVRREGKPLILSKIIRRPYVYVEYLHLDFNLDRYSSSMFDNVIDYVSKAKKRIKHYCIEICSTKHVCTQQTFEDINDLIEKINPFHLELYLAWNDHKLTVEIPNIKNVYSIFPYNRTGPRETVFHMNPCARYKVHTAQDFRDIVLEFTKTSRLQHHLCDISFFQLWHCRAMLQKEWNLEIKEADETLKSRFLPSQSNDIPLYASIPSDHGDIEIFITDDFIVIQRKESYVGQWKDFYSNVKSPIKWD